MTLIPTAAAEDQETKLLILGDSLSAAYGLLESEGWVNLLKNKWHSDNYEIEVINAAISGDTTEGGLARLPRLLTHHAPTHIFIELGGNDGLRGQSIANMKANLKKMIALSKQANVTVMLQSMNIPSNYGRRYTQLFSNTFANVADEQQVILIPFFLNDIALDDELMQNDGIHPNKAAQPLIADIMFEQLTPIIWP